MEAEGADGEPATAATTGRGRVRTEQGHKRVRAFLAGQLVLDTDRPTLVWEIPYFPTYYVPAGDVRAALVGTGQGDHSPSRGDADIYDLVTDRATAPGAARRYPRSLLPEIRDLVRLEWASMDEWFEEDEPVYTHPRDPYTRVDILASSRRVRIELDGVVLAESGSPRILFETGLPPRYYLPMTDVRLDLLKPTETRSHCPYKGEATYWSVEIEGREYPDYVWGYRTPLPESQKVAGLLCFYNEKVDLYLDDQLEDRPHTVFD